MKILIADDDRVTRRMVGGLLHKWGYEIVMVEDGNAALECLTGAIAPQLALLDWMMPGLDGLQLCREIRRIRPEPYTYIVLLTARDAKDSVVEGLEAGADDYLTKPFHALELKARLRVGIRLLNLEDNLVQARELMRFKATHDVLTGVGNRGAVLDTLERELARSRRERTPLGMLIADLDHFKSVNDTKGHLVGDEVLRECARRMRSVIRSYDSIGRYGGEEFLFLLPGCNRTATQEAAERVRKIIDESPIPTAAGALHITTSVGGASSEDWPRADSNALLRAADAALYRAKHAGRNRTVMRGPDDAAPGEIPGSEDAVLESDK